MNEMVEMSDVNCFYFPIFFFPLYVWLPLFFLHTASVCFPDFPYLMSRWSCNLYGGTVLTGMGRLMWVMVCIFKNQIKKKKGIFFFCFVLFFCFLFYFIIFLLFPFFNFFIFFICEFAYHVCEKLRNTTHTHKGIYWIHFFIYFFFFWFLNDAY